MLDDFAPDGLARKATTFADGLNIPIGVLPLGRGDSALVHAIPAIRRYTDKDGDGKADSSEELYTSFGFRDTHGMTNAFTWGFDGWIYACHGFNNESSVKGSDGKPIVMQSGNTYRIKPDGSHAEYVTHGQVNPFGLSFDPVGNLYSCDCHSRPIYCLLPGAYYPSFGKPDDGLGFGPEMLQHDHGSTGIAGIVYYAADHFPAAYRDTIFIGNVVTSRINRDTLTWIGATPKATATPDFLSSDDPWFRPVDIELGPDGALYVADFYNRIIGHYEVPLTHPGRDRTRGRIWRIVYTGKDAMPLRSGYDGTKLSVADLVSELGDPNIARRIKAANILVERGKDGVAGPVTAAATDASPLRRLHAIWVLHRLGLVTPEMLHKATGDPEAIVRTHALKVIGERTGQADAEFAAAKSGLSDSDAFVRRAAAEALNRGGIGRLDALVGAIHAVSPGDTHLRHVLRIALRDNLEARAVWVDKFTQEVANPHRTTLEIMGGGTWPPKDGIVGDLVDVLPGIPRKAAATFLLAYLSDHRDQPADAQARFARHIARYAVGVDLPMLAEIVAASKDVGTKVLVLKAIQEGIQARGELMPPALTAVAESTARALLGSATDREYGQGIDLVGALKLGQFRAVLGEIIVDRARPEPRRIKAIESLVAIDAKGAVPVLDRVVLDASAADAIRERTATLLASANQEEARNALIKALPTAPGKLQTVIATGLAQTATGGLRLIEAIEAGKASARLLQERGVQVRLAALNQPALTKRIDTLLKGLPPAEARIQTLIAGRRSSFAKARPDTAKGALLYEKNCATCHQLGGKGARIGPQLDGVGVRGVDRLLEDVLDPNRNVDQAFRVTSLSLKDGQVVSGLLLREEGQVLVMADAQGKDVRVPRDQVDDRKVSQLSPMPANWAEQISEGDLADLLAYLLSQTPKGEPPGR